MVLQLDDALAAATKDGGPTDALQSDIKWRQEVKALLALATSAAKKIVKHTLLDRAVFYVSGAHHESYGSTGHPHDILAVTDDAADVALFYGRKGMNVAFRVQNFKDVIKLIATSIWTATPTTEQRRLAVLVLNAWASHANGEATSHSLLKPQHACGGVSWLRATTASMEAGALAADGTTPIDVEGTERRYMNSHAISMWLLREEAGPLSVDDQQSRLLSDDEAKAFREIHFDCTSVCRGRCSFENGVPKMAIVASGDNECLCTFGGASRCWLPACPQPAATTAISPPTTTDKPTTNETTTEQTDTQAETVLKSDTEPETNKDAPHDDVQQPQQTQVNVLQLAQRKYAPLRRFTHEQAEELLAQLTTSEMRSRVIERATENVGMTDETFESRVAQHSSGRRITGNTLSAIAWPLIQQHRDMGHEMAASKLAIFAKMTERISAQLQVFTCEDEQRKREAGGEVLVAPPTGCTTWQTSAHQGEERVHVALRSPNGDLPVGSVMVARVTLGQRVMITTLQQHPGLTGQLGTVTKAVEMTCTEAEDARVVVSYTSNAVTNVPAPALDAEGLERVNTVASTVVSQVSVKPRNLAIVMKEEVDGIVTCYGMSGTPLGEGAAVRESRAHSTTESRRLLTGMFADETNETARPVTEAVEAAPAKPAETPAKTTGEPTVTTPDGERATEGEGKGTADQLEHPDKSDATPEATTYESSATPDATPAAVASMLQGAGLAALLSVPDVLKALEHDPTAVTFTVRAMAWNKLDAKEQASSLEKAREHRGALELPSRGSYSSMHANSLCEHCDVMMYRPALNADSVDRLCYHMQRDEGEETIHLSGIDMQAGSMWTTCGSYVACVQCAGAQAILNDPLQAHTSAACILGDGLLIAALRHYVRGDFRKTETGEPAARKAGDQARPEETHTTKRDSRSPVREGSRAPRKRQASRSPDRRPRHRGSRSRSDRRGRPRDRSRTPRRRSRSRNRRSRSRNRSPSPRREHRSKADSHHESKR